MVSRANLIQGVYSVRPGLEITPSDMTIRTKLLEELREQPRTHPHELNITVANGVVDLWGYAESDMERRAITAAAKAIPGVVAINDHLMREPAFVH
jgi:osmotically-inducible protein OsmY